MERMTLHYSDELDALSYARFLDWKERVGGSNSHNDVLKAGRVKNDPGDSFDFSSFQSFSIPELIAFLMENHRYFIESVFPVMEHQLVQCLRNGAEEGRAELLVLEKLIGDRFHTLKIHFEKEENELFRQVLELQNKPLVPNTQEAVALVSILAELEADHRNIRNEFELMRSYLVHFSTGKQDMALKMLIRSLAILEHDLAVHDLVEDKILLPRMKEILLRQLAVCN